MRTQISKTENKPENEEETWVFGLKCMVTVEAIKHNYPTGYPTGDVEISLRDPKVEHLAHLVGEVFSDYDDISIYRDMDRTYSAVEIEVSRYSTRIKIRLPRGPNYPFKKYLGRLKEIAKLAKEIAEDPDSTTETFNKIGKLAEMLSEVLVCDENSVDYNVKLEQSDTEGLYFYLLMTETWG